MNSIVRTARIYLSMKLLFTLTILPSIIFSQNHDTTELRVLAEKFSGMGKFKKSYTYYYKLAEKSKNYTYYIKAAETFAYSHNTGKEKNNKHVEYLYNKSMVLKPWNTLCLLSRAEYDYNRAYYIGAIRDIDSLLVRDPTNTEAYLIKTKIYMEKRDTTNAFRIYDIAISKVTKDDGVRIYLDKGYRCYLKGFWKQSIDSYLTILKTYGTDKLLSIHYCNLSADYYQLGEDMEACKYFKWCEVEKYHGLYDKEALIKLCK